jgi:hypothetical protein
VLTKCAQLALLAISVQVGDKDAISHSTQVLVVVVRVLVSRALRNARVVEHPDLVVPHQVAVMLLHTPCATPTGRTARHKMYTRTHECIRGELTSLLCLREYQ